MKEIVPMHSYYARLNSIMMYAMFHSLFIILVIQLTTYYGFERQASVSNVQIREVDRFRVKQDREMALIVLDFDVDLSKVWDWNVKQLFVWVEVSYESKLYKKNNIIVWDHIVHSKEESVFHMERTISDYIVEDPGKGLKNNKLTVKVAYDIFPWVGLAGKNSNLLLFFFLYKNTNFFFIKKNENITL